MIEMTKLKQYREYLCQLCDKNILNLNYYNRSVIHICDIRLFSNKFYDVRSVKNDGWSEEKQKKPACTDHAWL